VAAHMKYQARSLIALVLYLFLFAPSSIVLAQDIEAEEYRQSEAVKQRYPDPAVAFGTPGFAPGKTDFTSHDEMMAFLHELHGQADNMSLRILGHSQEGRAIPLLVFSNSGRFAAADLLQLDRPVVFLQGLQHGNEPAGGEVMLALAQDLAAGPLRPLLDKISVLIVPRCNPDGAHYFTRDTPRRIDINRDHIKMDLPETIALHRALNEFQPEVIVDAHEFSVATRWIQKFGLLQFWDLMLIYATNPNVPSALTETAEKLFRRPLIADIERAGYSHFWYYTTSYNLQDKRVSMGGTAPDIGRNTSGLQNAISFLVESRGVGIGRESYGRRVHTHHTAITSILRSTAEHGNEVMRVVRETRAGVTRRGLTLGSGNDVVVTTRSRMGKQKLTMIEPDSGTPKEIEVDWEDTLAAQPGLVRRRPYAYLMRPSFADVARRLTYSGIEVKQLRKPVTLEVESYQVLDRRAGATFVEGHIRNTVTTEVELKKMTFPAGTFVFPMAQTGANFLAVALEPESPSSFVSAGFLPVDKKGTHPSIGAPSEVPIYRLMEPLFLDVAPVDAR
jgi:Zinc carboxypeptidase